MRFSDEAITQIIQIISSVSDLTIFPYTRQTTEEDSFIVVNTLSLPNDVLQRSVLNVNIHTKDIQGYINNAFLNAEKRKVIEAVENHVPDNNNYLDFHFQAEGGTFQEPEINEHYVNLRFEYYLLN
jgi:phosphoribosylpyrophosphate synthetase